MGIRRLTSAAVVLVFMASACGGNGGPPVTSPEYTAFREQPTACGAERPPAARDMQFEGPEESDVPDTTTAVIHTSCGDITITLYPQIAPVAVLSFVFLAEHGYYDGTVTQRISPGYVVQFGDPTATGFGSPGYVLRDELPPTGFPYGTGIVGMANSGRPNTSGSQFFIVLGDTALPATYTVFGIVVDGADALTAIQSVPLGIQPGGAEPSRPLETVYIESIDIQR